MLIGTNLLVKDSVSPCLNLYRTILTIKGYHKALERLLSSALGYQYFSSVRSFSWLEKICNTKKIQLKLFDKDMEGSQILSFLLRTEVRGDFNIHGTKYF